ncbi:MAG: ABC transporter permease, partial [Sedimentibacter sp.]
MNTLILTSIEQGLIFSVLAIGVTITFKILDFADMSVEGTFPMGAFIFAKLITSGLSPATSTILAFFLGTLAGLITYTLNIKLKIKALLSGILTMTILYSVNLRLNGKSNVGLFNYSSIFDNTEVIIILIIIAAAVKIAMDIFLKTEIGYLLIATGDNETLVKSLGEDSNKYKLIGLMLSNGLVALSGA